MPDVAAHELGKASGDGTVRHDLVEIEPTTDNVAVLGRQVFSLWEGQWRHGTRLQLNVVWSDRALLSVLARRIPYLAVPIVLKFGASHSAGSSSLALTVKPLQGFGQTFLRQKVEPQRQLPRRASRKRQTPTPAPISLRLCRRRPARPLQRRPPCYGRSKHRALECALDTAPANIESR